MSKAAFRGLFFVVFLAAVLLRFAWLDLRPMHHDESNQAVKFGALLEKGEYRYDKADHHGPTLYYLTLPVAWAFSKSTLASLDEATLRLVPALFGVGVVLLLLLFLKGAGRLAVLFAGVFAALSPAMVYYSRFYIQEMLFAFFVLGLLASIWRFLLDPALGWALAAGFFAGLMYSTKETAVIVFVAAGLAYLLTLAFDKIYPQTRIHSAAPSVSSFVLALIVAGLVATVLFTSFFKNPDGIWDSFQAFKVYIEKSGTTGAAAGFHVQPWSYYLKLLGYSKPPGGPLWSEGLIFGLALFGMISGFIPRRMKSTLPSPARFFFFYALLATAAFSLIPYKTPWNVSSFWLGWIVLAGIGAAFLVDVMPVVVGKVIILLALAAGIYNLGLQSYRANYQFYADPANPYVYAQTSKDFMKLIDRVNKLAGVEPVTKYMPIKVICGPYETWPLPWYLRRFTNVGYWQEAKEAGRLDDAPLIIADQNQSARIQALLGDKFQVEYFGLRPNVLLVLYVRQDLWQEYLKEKK